MVSSEISRHRHGWSYPICDCHKVCCGDESHVRMHPAQPVHASSERLKKGYIVAILARAGQLIVNETHFCPLWMY